MEAIGEFIPDRAPWAGPAVSSRLPRLAAVPGAADAAGGALGAAGAAVDSALTALRAQSPTADVDAAWFGLREAADFAGHVEDLSRTVEYFQLVAAAAVERTRKQIGMSAAADDGYRNGTEFLRARLRISATPHRLTTAATNKRRRLMVMMPGVRPRRFRGASSENQHTLS